MKKKSNLSLGKGEKLVKGPGGKMGIWRSVNGNSVFLPDGEDPKKVIAADIAKAKGRKVPSERSMADVANDKAEKDAEARNPTSKSASRVKRMEDAITGGKGWDKHTRADEPYKGGDYDRMVDGFMEKGMSRDEAKAKADAEWRKKAKLRPLNDSPARPGGSPVDPNPDYSPEQRKRSVRARRSRGKAMQSGPTDLKQWASENDGWKESGGALFMRRENVTYKVRKDDESGGMGWVVYVTDKRSGITKKRYLTKVNTPHTFDQALKLIDQHTGPKKVKESGVIDPMLRDFLLLEAEPNSRSVCRMCRHWGGGDTCRAFPEGIPADIAEGDNDHSDPYPGDNGIQFAQKDDEAMDDQIDTEMDD